MTQQLSDRGICPFSPWEKARMRAFEAITLTSILSQRERKQSR
jgi:hypothetical protein